MLDSLGVKVPAQPGGGEGLEKRKGVSGRPWRQPRKTKPQNRGQKPFQEEKSQKPKAEFR